MSHSKSDWDRRLGHGWRQIINRTPLVYLDRVLTGLLYAPDAATKRQTNDLAKAHGAGGSGGDNENSHV